MPMPIIHLQVFRPAWCSPLLFLCVLVPVIWQTSSFTDCWHGHWEYFWSLPNPYSVLQYIGVDWLQMRFIPAMTSICPYFLHFHERIWTERQIDSTWLHTDGDSWSTYILVYMRLIHKIINTRRNQFTHSETYIGLTIMCVEYNQHLYNGRMKVF